MSAAREAAAYHEAGHAVVAWVFGDWVRERGIGISHDGTGNIHVRRLLPEVLALEWAAAVAEPEAAFLQECIRWRVERELLHLLAGGEAERLAGRGLGGDSDDVLEAVTLAETFADLALDSMDGAGWLDDVLEPRVRELLRRPDVWAAVERVARALLRSGNVSCDDLEALMAEAPPAREFAPWERTSASRQAE